MTTALELPAGESLAIGIELGSTRIKAVLIGPAKEPLATGSHEWENSYENGVWTYSLDAVKSTPRFHNCFPTRAIQWENSYENGVWTYSLDAVWQGLRTS